MSIGVSIVKDNVEVSYSDWTFGSTRHWGELAEGTWQLSVRDMYKGPQSADSQGEFSSWSIIVWNDKLSEEAPNDWIVSVAVLVAIVIVIAGLVATFLILKKRGLLPKVLSRCKRSHDAAPSVLNVSNGLASEEDFDFDDEPETLFLSSASEDDHMDEARRTVKELDNLL